MNKKYILATILALSLAIFFRSLISDANVTGTAKLVSLNAGSPDALQISPGEKSEDLLYKDELSKDCKGATTIFTSLPPKCLVNGKLISIEPEPEYEAVYQENGVKIYLNSDYSGE